MTTVSKVSNAGVDEKLIAFPLLFRQQVVATPQAIAVTHEGRQFTYRQLERMADCLADQLTGRGVVAGAYVGLCADRSAEAIAAMIGVMKVGAAFVPLDPEYPVDRLSFMVQDAAIDVIVAQPDCRRLLADSCAAVSDWIELRDDLVDQAAVPACDITVPADALAYLMYTSGSTGKPKGVQIDHAALATYCFADIDVYRLESADRTLQFSTLNFDIAIEEIFPPLISGGCVCVRPRQRSAHSNELSALIESDGVTAVHIATAYWHEWVDLMVASGSSVPDSIRLMVVTGEKVSVEHYKRWLGLCNHDVLWCNAYGPTEATVSATVFIPDEGFDAANMPIGKPLKRYDAYVLDGDLRPVAAGQTGVLYLGGPALARGYLNRPDLTDQVFVNVAIDGTPVRLYNTGDLARWLPGGEIDFGGRVDHQIKIGSYRIEPGEIEAIVDQYPGVLESLVSDDSIESKKYLVAYCAVGDADIDVLDLSEFLRDQLPVYMIPTRYVFVDRFPKTTNGKIDRKALPDAATGVVPRPRNTVAPRTELEIQLVDVWKQVLNLDEIGVHDDFFLLGGSSLLVTRVVTQLARDLDVELPVRDFFANPTVALAARHIESLLGIESTDIQHEALEYRRRLPIVRPGFFGGPRSDQTDALFGVHYQPPELCQTRRGHGVLICHSYGHEYTRAYRNLQQLSVQLAQSGYDVLRFDYAGTGNSGGDTVEATFQRMCGDAAAAANHLRELADTETVSVIGVRLGATIAANADLGSVRRMVFWDPVVDGGDFVRNAESLHHYATKSLNRFSTRRTSVIDQVFGHQTSTCQRASFYEAKIPTKTKVAGTEKYVVTSQDYVLSPSGASGVAEMTQWQTQETADEIYWDRPEFTESAFASPGLNRFVTDVFQDQVV